MPERKPRIAPSVRFVRSLEGQYHLLREAAEMLGVSHRTLRNFNSQDAKNLGPSFYTYFGKTQIYLYTDDDVERLRKHIDASRQIYDNGEPQKDHPHQGRPAKWTPAQRKARQRLFSQVHYYKNMAEKHINHGQPEKADKAVKKMRSIQKKLKEQELDKIYGKNFDDIDD